MFNPIGIKIITAIKKQIANLYIINQNNTTLDNYALYNMKIPKKKTIIILSEILKYMLNSTNFTHKPNENKEKIDNILSKYSINNDFIKQNNIVKEKLNNLFNQFLSSKKPLLVYSPSEIFNDEMFIIKVISDMFEKNKKWKSLIPLDNKVNFLGVQHVANVVTQKCKIPKLKIKNIDDLFTNIENNNLKSYYPWESLVYQKESPNFKSGNT